MNRNSKRWMTPSAAKSPVVTLPADARRRLALVARSLAPEHLREVAIEARTN